MTAATFLAACGATAAILCTLALNAWHGWPQGNTLPQQVGLVAINVTIDLIKCGGLTAVSALWALGYRLRATLLLPLWALAFAWSTFCGYSAILSTRTTTSLQVSGQEQSRARAQRRYDELTSTLNTAKSNPLWQASSGCTAIRPPHRAFCASIERATAERDAAAATLAAVAPVKANPEMEALARESGQPLPWIIFLAALFPAVLLELIASIGFWAVGPRPRVAPLQVPQERRSWLRWVGISRDRKAAPAALPEPPAVVPSSVAAGGPKLTWKMPKPA